MRLAALFAVLLASAGLARAEDVEAFRKRMDDLQFNGDAGNGRNIGSPAPEKRDNSLTPPPETRRAKRDRSSLQAPYPAAPAACPT